MTMYDILYAEDEFTNRKLLEIHLQKAGLSHDLAADGLQAWSKFQENQYKIIILDQYMPGLNGDQLARKILEQKPDQKLLAITSDDTEVENLRKAGFSEVFIKPLRSKEYLEVIKNYLKEIDG